MILRIITIPSIDDICGHLVRTTIAIPVMEHAGMVICVMVGGDLSMAHNKMPRASLAGTGKGV